jgi:hypothetical protein
MQVKTIKDGLVLLQRGKSVYVSNHSPRAGNEGIRRDVPHHIIVWLMGERVAMVDGRLVAVYSVTAVRHC